MLRMARHVHRETGEKNLCLAGGVALNCVGNGRILREGPFEKIWIQPAAGDAGGAWARPLLVWHQYLGKARCLRSSDGMRGATSARHGFDSDESPRYLRKTEVPYTELTDEEIPDTIADLIADGEGDRLVPGTHGIRTPRTRQPLHYRRCPLAEDAGGDEPEDQVPRSFRPFAPAVLGRRSRSTSISTGKAPYMLLVAPVRQEICREMTDEEEKRFGLKRNSTWCAPAYRRSRTSTTRRASRP